MRTQIRGAARLCKGQRQMLHGHPVARGAAPPWSRMLTGGAMDETMILAICGFALLSGVAS